MWLICVYLLHNDKSKPNIDYWLFNHINASTCDVSVQRVKKKCNLQQQSTYCTSTSIQLIYCKTREVPRRFSRWCLFLMSQEKIWREKLWKASRSFYFSASLSLLHSSTSLMREEERSAGHLLLQPPMLLCSALKTLLSNQSWFMWQFFFFFIHLDRVFAAPLHTASPRASHRNVTLL